MNNSTINFRSLRPEEVDVRPNSITENKVQLLLYQDARCAMNILDSTLGPTAWQKEYYEAAGLLFCRIGIYDEEKKQWIWKSDTGSKSNIEEGKGQASDAFKRAAVAWGIGRELYTTPRISINLNEKDFYRDKLCQSFHVGEMVVKDGTITNLTILDKWDNTRFSYPSGGQTAPMRPEQPSREVGTSSNTSILKEFCASLKKENGTDIQELTRFFHYYSKPSKEDSSKSVADSIRNFDPRTKWESWTTRAKQKVYYEDGLD